MKFGGKLAFCLAAFGCATVTRAVVNDGDNPYAAIVERNVFGLKDPPPPQSNEPPKPPPANITLTGITDILGRKLALLEWVEPNIPGQPANNKKNYSTLTEGQREGQIEVLEINVKNGAVKVSNYGQVSTLTLNTNVSKLLSVPYTPPPIGGVPSPTAGIPPAPPSAPGASGPTFSTTTSFGANPSAAASGIKTIPQRQLRLPVAAQTAPQPTAQAAPQNQVSVEEQELLMEVEAEVNRETQAATPNPKYPPPPPPPPTSLNPTRDLAQPK